MRNYKPSLKQKTFMVIILIISTAALFITHLNAQELTDDFSFHSIPKTSYDYSSDDIAPGNLSKYSSWQSIEQFDAATLPKSGHFWLRLTLPPVLWDNPAIVINAFLEAFKVYDDTGIIYSFPEDKFFNYYSPHMIAINKNDKAGVLYCRLIYSDSSGIGEIDSILVGSEQDLLEEVANNREAIYRQSIIDICQGFLLFMAGIGSLFIFLFRFREREYPFLSFGFFSAATGITYLTGVHPLCFINVSPLTYLYLKTGSFLLVPVGLFALVENIFEKGYYQIHRRLWQFHLIFPVAAFLLISQNIDYTLIFLPVLIINGLLCCLSIAFTRLETISDNKIKIFFIAFLLLFVSLTLLHFLKTANLTSWSYDLFGWGMLLFTFALGNIMIQHYRNTFKEMQSVSLELEKNKSEMLELQKEKLESQLEALKNQLDPHFLFNNLSTLTSIIEEDQDVAVNFVKELSLIYRYVLQTKVHTLVSLTDELDFIQSYSFLMSHRFGNNFKLMVTVNEEIGQLKIIPFCLQLLVENAIKHNIISVKKPLTIKIFNDKDSYLVVENNLQVKSQPVESTNIGLDNIQNRYKLITDKAVSIIKSKSAFIVKVPLLDGYEIAYKEEQS